MSHPNELKEAREAVWTAIEGNSAINDQLEGKFKFDSTYVESNGEQTEPSISKVPALAIQPMLLTPENRFQGKRLPYRLLVRFWTPHWNLETAETLMSRIIKVISNDATLKQMKPAFNVGFFLTHLKGPKQSDTGPRVVRADMQLTLETCLQ